MINKNLYSIDKENIKYCIITIIHEELSVFNQIYKLFSNNYEHIVTETDKMILEIDSEIYELNDIKCKDFFEFSYSEYGFSPNMFPKKIREKKNNKKFDNKIYLSFIEPSYDEKKSQYTCDFTPIYVNYQNFKKDSSYYNIIYQNIFTKNIDLSIVKVKYDGELTSKYIVAYNTKYLDKEKIFTILKKIFIGKKE